MPTLLKSIDSLIGIKKLILRNYEMNPQKTFPMIVAVECSPMDQITGILFFFSVLKKL
jgi:hypothetical protein